MNCTRGFGLPLEIGLLAVSQRMLGREGREQVHQPGDDTGPARLVAGPKPGPVVAVEILVEQQAIAPVRIVLELRRSSVDRPTAIRAFRKMFDSRRAISSAT